MKVRIFFIELKRSLNPGFFLCMAGVCFSICFDSWNDLMRALSAHSGSVHYFFANSSFGGVCRSYLLPVFASLPFACSFCKEYNENISPVIVAREGEKTYCFIKYLVVMLSGGAAVAMATGILFLLLASVFPVADPIYQNPFAPKPQLAEPFHTWLSVNHPLLYGLAETANGFLRGCLWSGIALCVSAYIPDSFVTIASPYLISMTVAHTERLLRIEETFRLERMLTGRYIMHSTGCTLLLSFFAVGAVSIALAVLFSRKVQWRIQNE